MDAWWDANALDSFIEHMIRANLQQHVRWNRHALWAIFLAKMSNRQTRKRSEEVARKHYDLSALFPEALLDSNNQYTCAYFDGTDDLNVAQEKKLELHCRKLQLCESDRVLDIGCGWGGFARFAAKRHGCTVTGINISEEQIKYARKFCEGLPVDIQHRDYRDLEGTYDKILTCGMLEHVGHKNYRQFFQIVHDHMSNDGLFVLQCIGGNATGSLTDTGRAFTDKYIFPNGELPSITQIEEARKGLFTLQDAQNLAVHYSKTLRAWHKNLIASWPNLTQTFDERFRRMFEYYLLSFKGGFDAGLFQLWQLVFSKAGHVMDYRGAR
jgi:cyclopropane-fatty-acyl-phospholipid synthase